MNRFISDYFANDASLASMQAFIDNSVRVEKRSWYGTLGWCVVLGGGRFRGSEIGDYGVSCGSNKAILRGSVISYNGSEKGAKKQEQKGAKEQEHR
ncbi:hypothetical protein L195_g036223 [Trifolium pratense]|uniref:Uncharacterized protein n=1 Tax=Trifolium pratense TaxID=57577 RepID=A0A2K3LNV8_TRIPR|nr:hypothetical protein L195_g036223 [Trifolium pratense]